MPIEEVTPIEGERWCFHIHSRSRPGTKWRVDLEAYNWNGACDCEDFHFSREPDLKRGAKPSDDFRCFHVLAARSYVMETIFPMLAKALGGPRMPEPGAGPSAMTRAKESIESIKTVPGLMELRQLITGRIDEMTDNEQEQQEQAEQGEKPDPRSATQSGRAAQKVYHLEDRRFERR